MADRQLKVVLDLDFGPGTKNLIPELKKQVEDFKRAKNTPAGGGTSTQAWMPGGQQWTGTGYTNSPAYNPGAVRPGSGWANMPMPNRSPMMPPGFAPLGGTTAPTGLMPTWATGTPLGGPGSAIHGYAPPPPPGPNFPTGGNLMSGNRAGAQPTGGGLSGLMGGGLGQLAKFFAPLLAAQSVVGAASTIGANVNDPYLTEGQAQRRFFRNVMPFGGTIQDTVDNISGRTAGYERAGINSELRRSRTEAEMTGTAFGLQNNPMIAGLSERNRQMQAASPILMGGVDRSTATGERDFREKSRLLPIEREIAKAERDAAVATKERRATEQELYKITSRGNELVQERSRLQDKLARGDDAGVKRQETLLRLADNEAAIEANIAARQAGQGAVFAARQREAQAAGTPALARARLSEARAENLEERANTASQAAFNLGSQGPFERAKGLQAFKFLQQTGNPDMLPPSMRAAALQFGGAEAQKIVEKFGASTAEFQEGKQLAPSVFADPEALRKQAGAARDQAEKDKMAAEAAMSAAGAKAGESLGNTVARVIADMVRAAESRIYTQLKLTKNAQ